MHWQTSRCKLDLSLPRVMGIVNLTPDSFSDGGRYMGTRSALAQCEKLLADGADILDLGAESSRPGTPPVSEEEELKRLLPVLSEAVKLGAPISVDTYKPGVMSRALDLGADIVNDIWALRQPGARDVVVSHPSCGVCLMHMHGEPQTMQREPLGGDAVPQVLAFLRTATQALTGLGVDRSRVVWDVGIGFGKSLAQNFNLMARQSELLADGHPLMVGWSRKSSLGTVTGMAVNERLVPSVAAALLSVERGARIVRVHDVRDTVAALKVWVATISVAKNNGTGGEP
jgi:dihydropteroate synthase